MSRNSRGNRPVFYDERSRRWPWVVRAFFAILIIVVAALSVFLVSILALPLLPHNTLPRSKAIRDTLTADPNLTNHQQAGRVFKLKRAKGRLAREIERERRTVATRRAEVSSRHRPGGPVSPRSAGIHVAASPESPKIVAGFYVNWEETSRASLRRNISQITHFIPEWLHISRDGSAYRDGRTQEDRLDIEPLVRGRGLPIIPILSNYTPIKPGSEVGGWNSDALRKLVANLPTRTRLIHDLKLYVQQQKWQGINIDFEMVDPADRDTLTQFMQELCASFHASRLLVTQDIQLDADGFDLAALADCNDFLIPMFYDQNSPGDAIGSIAGIAWTRDKLEDLLQTAPANKIVMGLGNYAYDWVKGKVDDAAHMNFQSAVLQAKESRDPANPEIARIKIDPASLNPYYKYFDDSNAEHIVWMLDATTVYNQLLVARPHDLAGVALWYLGSEDPSIWNIIGSSRLNIDQGPEIDRGLLDKISYGRQSEVDFEGEGELLEVVAEPNDGNRQVRRDPKSCFITHESYQSYPSGYVVRRYGYQPKKVVLTFDDGPDSVYTPQILDILKQEGVKGTFFVVGVQADMNPGVLARMWDEGHEIGNHTFYHPNLAEVSDGRTMMEISATQRLIEAVTGHSTTLFRPPYAIDVEPRTGGELKPIMLASRANFISVGEKNDPQDWNLVKKGPHHTTLPRTADDIVASVWENRDEGNVILLHDAGGDRSLTIAALPKIIDKLKAAGYQFISVSDLRGLPRTVLFPAVTGREEALVGVDKWVFEIAYLTIRILTTLFTLSVILGVSRQIFISGLALIQRRREARRELAFMQMLGPQPADGEAPGPNGDRGNAQPPEPGGLPIGLLPALGGAYPVVSVIIAAFNEEKVIERTIGSILASDYPALEVIAVDDGSTDGTYEAVTCAFQKDSRVRCLRKENGGKSSALNLGLGFATGEIIVALDADTLFAKDAISRLVRHFVDPLVGAVSGNVRVGNPHNILTRWQALEYITSQNFDRRAYDLMNCITVVPGAIGAWRKEAIEDAGGYTPDTLAEDTDLTWKIRQAGWRILNDSTALAYTEAPETLSSLARQRYRWAFGTLQNLWKHREALGRHGAFGWVAMPSLWLYQIVFPAVSPIMDLTVIVAIFAGNLANVAFYYGLMIGFEFLGAALAIWMDKGNWRLLPWLFLQRFVYRQLMYYVILKSLFAAIRGAPVGWNKLERRGTARVGV